MARFCSASLNDSFKRETCSSDVALSLLNCSWSFLILSSLSESDSFKDFWLVDLESQRFCNRSILLCWDSVNLLLSSNFLESLASFDFTPSSSLSVASSLSCKDLLSLPERCKDSFSFASLALQADSLSWSSFTWDCKLCDFLSASWRLFIASSTPSLSAVVAEPPLLATLSCVLTDSFNVLSSKSMLRSLNVPSMISLSVAFALSRDSFKDNFKALPSFVPNPSLIRLNLAFSTLGTRTRSNAFKVYDEGSTTSSPVE